MSLWRAARCHFGSIPAVEGFTGAGRHSESCPDLVLPLYVCSGILGEPGLGLNIIIRHFKFKIILPPFQWVVFNRDFPAPWRGLVALPDPT